MAVTFAYDNAGNMTRPDAVLEPGRDDGGRVNDLYVRFGQSHEGDHRQELERDDAGLVCLHLRRGRPGEPGDADAGLRDRRPTR